jgi:H/ACA ribonucleoprotein complex subunit 4
MIDTSKWPLLLKNYDKLHVRTGPCSLIPAGHSPLRRPIKEYMTYGCLNLEKPSKASSHEVVTWLKKILHVEKIGNSETLDYKDNGNLILCINRATRIVKIQQGAGQTYCCICRFLNHVGDGALGVVRTIETLTGALFQRAPRISGVKNQLRIRTIYQNRLLEYHDHQRLAVLRLKCQAGTYVRTLCVHIGLILGVGGHMQDLRRIRSGLLGDNDNLVTMHDVLDAMWFFSSNANDVFLRRVIMPLEVLLLSFKRIVVKDSAINALCYGAKLMIPGLLRFEDGVEIDDKVVLITTKGEAVGIGTAQMNTSMMASYGHGSVVKINKVIMERNMYPRRWSTGLIKDEKIQGSQEAMSSTVLMYLKKARNYQNISSGNAQCS